MPTVIDQAIFNEKERLRKISDDEKEYTVLESRITCKMRDAGISQGNFGEIRTCYGRFLSPKYRIQLTSNANTWPKPQSLICVYEFKEDENSNFNAYKCDIIMFNEIHRLLEACRLAVSI